MSEVSVIGVVNALFRQSAKTLTPLFEASQNAIDAIEEEKPENPEIKITVSRSAAGLLKGFVIRDNGVGFTEKQYSSFRVVGSRKKEKIGGKGLGRLSWLPFFKDIQIESWYTEPDGERYHRSFSFHLDDMEIIRDHQNKKVASTPEKKGTLVSIGDIREGAYSKKLQAHKDETIIKALIKENLGVLLNSPDLNIIFRSGDEEFPLNELLAGKVEKITDSPEIFHIGQNEFRLNIYQFDDDKYLEESSLQWIANNRPADNISLKQVCPFLSDSSRGGGPLIVQVESTAFDQRVSHNRSKIEFDENNQYSFFETEGHLFEDDVKEKVSSILKSFFDSEIKTRRKDTFKKVIEFIRNEHYSYSHLIRKMPEKLKDLNYKNEADLETRLFKLNQEYELEQKTETSRLLNMDVTDENYDELLQKVTENLSANAKSKLAEYVSHRKVVLTLLKKYLEMDEDGKYPWEKKVHQLIYPMGASSEENHPMDQNLWLIDERLAFHTFLSSDKPLSKGEGEPDIFCEIPRSFSEDEQDHGSIVIVEIKRPSKIYWKQGDKHNDPMKQAIGYIDAIREGKAKTPEGKRIRTTKYTRFFLYILATINDKLIKECLRSYSLAPTIDGLGYFGNFDIEEGLSGYVEVIDYDQIIQNAEKRNRILFSHLNI